MLIEKVTVRYIWWFCGLATGLMCSDNCHECVMLFICCPYWIHCHHWVVLLKTGQSNTLKSNRYRLKEILHWYLHGFSEAHLETVHLLCNVFKIKTLLVNNTDTRRRSIVRFYGYVDRKAFREEWVWWAGREVVLFSRVLELRIVGTFWFSD